MKLTQKKRAVISELLSIADLCDDIHTQLVISDRLKTLMSGSPTWVLTDKSICDLLRKQIARFEPVGPLVPPATDLPNEEGEDGLHLL